MGIIWCYQDDTAPKHAPTPMLHESGGHVPDSSCINQAEVPNKKRHKGVDLPP